MKKSKTGLFFVLLLILSPISGYSKLTGLPTYADIREAIKTRSATRGKEVEVLWLVGGLGNLGQRHIGPALKEILPQLDKNVLVLSVDQTHQMTNDVLPVRQKTADDQKESGIFVVDRNSIEGQKILREVKPKYVFIQTPAKIHLSAIKETLDFHPYGIRAIFVEKPLVEKKHEMDLLLEMGQSTNVPIFGVDLAYFPLIGGEDHFERKQAIRNIVGQLKEVVFIWIENHGADDQNALNLLDGPDPISREGRPGTLDAGMTLDLLPHFPPLAGEFIRFDSGNSALTPELLSFEALRFPNHQIPEKVETASASTWMFSEVNSSDRIRVTAYIGKGIAGVMTLNRKEGVHSLFLKGDQGIVELSYDHKEARILKKIEGKW